MAKEVERSRRVPAVQRPAPLVLRQGIPEVMIGSRADLLAQLKRGAKRGEYAGVSELVRLPGTDDWAVKVRRIREEPPKWRKPAIIAVSVVTALVALCGAGWLLISSIVSAVTGAVAGVFAGVSGGTVLVILIFAGLLLSAVSKPAVEVIVRVWK